MKKILFSLIIGLSITSLFWGCEDVNDQFKGIDDMVAPTNKTAYTYQLTDADYSTISKAALKIAANAEDSAKATSIATNKYFSASVPSDVYIPLLLKTSFKYGDVGTTANITYTYGNDRPSYLTDLTTINIISTEEYKTVWGDPIGYVSAFTPAKPASTNVPILLKAKFPTATSGTYKFVEYNYSSAEASSAMVDYKYFYDDFEAHTYLPSPYSPISEFGWVQKDTSGTKSWLNRLYSGNHYAQATSYNTTEENNIFLITKKIDLTLANTPLFSFDVNVGNWNADGLTILISEDFDGDKEHIKNATWVDLTSNFTIPQVPTTGYGTLAPAGTANLTSYAGKQVYIAFKYNGDSRTETTPKRTTTYQIDNVKVSETRLSLTIPSSEKQYVIYKYDGTNWLIPASNDGYFSILQVADYTAMGQTYLSSTNVPLYLPNYLKQKFPYALDGEVRTVVYKSGSNVTYSGATQYTLTNGVWTSNTFKLSKTEQYVFSTIGWVFDPTIKCTMVADDYKIIVDYVLATPAIAQFANPEYLNEEFYYGFSSRYSNVSFRLSYRDPYYFVGKAYQLPASADAELFALTTTETKTALMWTRLKEAVRIFLEKKYTAAVPQVNGIDVEYHVTLKVYTPDGITSTVTDTYTYKFKCTAAGAPATFEYLSHAKI